MNTQRPTSATQGDIIFRAKFGQNSRSFNEHIKKDFISVPKREINEYLRWHVDPIISDAISYMLSQQINAKIFPAILLEYFIDLRHKSEKKKFQSNKIKGENTRRVLRLFVATAIAPLILELVKRAIESKPLDAISFFISILEEKCASCSTDRLKTPFQSKRLSVDNHINDHSDRSTTCKIEKRQKESINILDKKEKKINILLLGVEGVGKSTLISVLKGSEDPKTRPSLGFCPISMKYMNNLIKFYDLGGGEKIRGIWENYFHDVHGIINIIDCACPEGKYDESISISKTTLGHKYLQGKPILIISNKEDRPKARPLNTIQQDINMLFEENGQSSIIQTSLHPKKRLNPDEAAEILDSALSRLIEKITSQFNDLQERVSRDTKIVEKIKEKEQEEKERMVLKNSICKAFSLCGYELSDVLSEEEGIEFLAHEVGLEKKEQLCIQGRQVAALVGYQKFALMLIGGMISPVRKSKEPWTWNRVTKYVESIITEIPNY